ncbi:TonB-dependent receptor, partial [Escherichia coli]|nr:TonB-dependent receptor [Escherichia coli]
TLAVYGSYGVSYLPSAGDQFRVLTPGLALAEPETFVNAEIGVKYEVTPELQLTAALFNLDRTNQPIPDPNNPGFVLGAGRTRTQGAEIGL